MDIKYNNAVWKKYQWLILDQENDTFNIKKRFAEMEIYFCYFFQQLQVFDNDYNSQG